VQTCEEPEAPASALRDNWAIRVSRSWAGARVARVVCERSKNGRPMNGSYMPIKPLSITPSGRTTWAVFGMAQIAEERILQ